MKTKNNLSSVSSRTLRLLIFVGAGLTCRLIADPIVVIPPGLAAGSQYRLLFVTDGLYFATSTNIATYNSDVNTEANSVAALAALGTTWLDIGSTSNVNAIDNVGQDPGVPIYNLEGQLMADDATQNTGGGLFRGDLVNETNNFYYESGGLPESGGIPGSGVTVWTGTWNNGEAALDRSDRRTELCSAYQRALPIQVVG
jgi:hypothetical protein